MNNGNHMTDDKNDDKKVDDQQQPPPKQQNGSNIRTKATTITTTTDDGSCTSIIRHGIHVIMFLLAVLLAITYIMQCVYHEYYVPLMKRAQRPDKKLMDEYTYYDRACNLVDLTATSSKEASAILYDDDSTTTVDDAVNTMMTHGAIMIPNLLSQDMITELRQFVVQKNIDVKGTPAEFPVSQGRNRISYGIEAAEHPAVSMTLKELHKNNKLKNLLEGLVGPNPALTEITAITAYYGCPPQAWHSDVKADGYAAKFGRTYSHSYSLFIPLQNTTGAMGATDICLGTHYCTDELHEICEEKKIGMHQVNNNGGDGVWKAGDAALLNQQVWHRGAKHKSKGSLERIVFIVSFIGRPIDTRQLARGTYFHMKWNMWGHTWQDLADAAVSMIWPFNVLRCLHIWKPKGRDWGFDLLTATAMRVANRQNGCEPWDLEILVHTLERMGLPDFLFGTIDYDNKNAWTIFIPETIAKAVEFLKQVNIGVLCIYFTILILVAIRTQRVGKETTGGSSGVFIFFLRSAVRLLVLYGTVWGLLVYTLHGIRISPWATNISSGRTLMRPFPPANTLFGIDNDPGVSNGPTTLPTRQDVLIGTRMNTKKLGAYRHWIKFHTGNRIFKNHFDKIGGKQRYRSYEEGLPKVLAESLVDGAYQAINQTGGRFLQQDYRTGDWRLMDMSESKEYIRLRLLLVSNPLLDALKDSFDLLLDEYRFEDHRGTTLSRVSQQYLFDLETILFGTKSKITDRSSSPSTVYRPHRTLRLVPLAKTTRRNLKRSIPAFAAFQDDGDFPLFSDVFVAKKEGWIQGTIVGFTSKGKVEVALYGEESYSYGVKIAVPREVLHKHHPNTEGMRVEANYKDKGTWFFGRITRVRPNGQADVLYDDGDFEKGVEYYNYSPLE